MSDDDRGGGGPGAPPSIAYTRHRTTSKTRTPATSARRRRNVPLCRASSSNNDDEGAKDPHAWFARKAGGWTDAEIRSHLASGGTSEGGRSLGWVGDVIVGAAGTTGGDKKGKREGRRRGGVWFAWEEEEEEEEEEVEGGRGAAPTLEDVMDDEDRAALLAPLKVGQQFQLKSTIDGEEQQGENDNGTKNKPRRQNAALAELAQVSGIHPGSGAKPTSAHDSIGWRLLRALGYRSRLGVAYVPLAGRAPTNDAVDDEVQRLQQEGTPAPAAKWLAARGVRAVRLPSVQTVEDGEDQKGTNKVLRIPSPKLNRHGRGYDPFKNAPEFRAFHDHRRALAQKRGRGAEADNADGGRGGRYFTDDVRTGRRAVWDTAGEDGKESEEEGDADERPSQGRRQHAHYAADRDYADFIGTKASSGFALRDEDDAHVYPDGEDGDAFPRGERGASGEGTGRYATEVQSPVASDDEDRGIDAGLFGKAAALGRRTPHAATQRAKGKEDGGNVVDAWSAWGMGNEGAGPPAKTTTMDGRPVLPGFALGQRPILGGGGCGRKGSDVPQRYRGPAVPAGYVLKRHAFPPEDDAAAAKSGAADGMDSGLGLDLHRRNQRPPSRSFVPQVLPPNPKGKMRARDGTEMNFHAVKASMKSRFVSSTSGTADAPNEAAPSDDISKAQDRDKEEWVQVAVAPWMPTRLLCKRWGVPVPSTAGMSAAGDGTTTGGKAKNREEDFFRQNVYEPAAQQRKDDGASQGTRQGGNGAGSGQELDPTMLDALDGEGPPPDRPDESVFQSIFDAAESDMDISSSEDEEEERAREDQDTSKGVPLVPAEKGNEGQGNEATAGAISAPSGQMDKIVASSSASDGSVSSSGSSSRSRQRRHRRKERRKEKRRRHRSRSPTHATDDESSGSDRRRRRRRRKKHKHKRRKHKH